MFRTIHTNEIFDLRMAQVPEDHPAYWLAQLRKADWQYLLKFVEVKLPAKIRKQILAEAALPHFEFKTCEGRGEIWQMWTELHRTHRVLVIQFRHSESDWSRGTPEFVHLEKNDPLGLVNIAGRLLCRVK